MIGEDAATMSEPRAPLSLADARERTVDALSTFFANDALTLEELERRIELAYRATSLTELQTLTSDLGPAGAVARAPAGDAAARPLPTRPAGTPMPATSERIVGIMSENHRGGVWPVPQRLEVRLLMANSRIDLTQSALPPVVDIHVRAVMAALEVRVPPGVHVVNHMGAFMGAVRVESVAPVPVPHGAPVVRLTGYAVMSEVKVKTE